MEEYVLAIDQGTTSTRVILFDHKQVPIAISQKEIAIYYPHDGWVEADAGEIYLSVIYCLNQIFQTTHIKASSIKAIGISNQRETTILWHKSTGIPVYNAIIWQSRQSEKIIEDFKERGLEEKIKAKTGLLLDPYFSASKIKWMYDMVPGLSKDDDDILFGTVDTWLLWKLTGGKVHATDMTNASRTLLFNIHDKRWDEDLCRLFDVPMHILPEIKDTSTIFGFTDPKILFNIDCPIAALVGDQQAALFGETCFKKGDIKNTYGTGGFILVNTKDELIITKSGLLSTIAWSIDGQIDYALEGSIFVSGSLIQWLRDGLKIIKDAKETESLAKSVEDDGGVVIVPAFVGLGAPHWDDKCRGSIFGLTRGTTKEHIVRAALQAMAFEVKDLVDVIAKETSTAINELKVDGGASENDFLLQYQSDLLDVRVVRPNAKEATALGAARLAGLAVGFYHMDDFKDVDLEVFKPRCSAKIKKDYKRWQAALDATKRFAHH